MTLPSSWRRWLGLLAVLLALGGAWAAWNQGPRMRPPSTGGALGAATDFGPAAINLAKTATALTVVPTLSVGITPSRASAIPLDPVRYTVTVTNTGAVMTVTGVITAQNVSLATATVQSWWDDLAYQLQSSESLPGEAGDLATGSASWQPLAGTGAAAGGYTPAQPPPISAGMAITLAPQAAAGVVYPSGGDPVVGTVITSQATASWRYTAVIQLTPAQANLATDPTQVDAESNRFHLEATPSANAAAQVFTAQADVTERVFGEEPDGGADKVLDGGIPEPSEMAGVDVDDGPVQSAAVTGLVVAVRLPSGQTVSFDNLPNLSGGGTTAMVASYAAPVPAAKGAGESDAAYTQRLQAIDGQTLTATATATGSGSGGAVSAGPAGAGVTEHLPVVQLAKSGPASADAGTTQSYPLTVTDAGGAGASTFAFTDSAPVGSAGVVLDTPPPVAPGGSAVAHASYVIPLAQPTGPLPDTATVTWHDGNNDLYGPLSASFTTAVVSPYDGATMTLAPAAAGPNLTGTNQPLVAVLHRANGSPIAGAPLTLAIAGANPRQMPGTTDGTGSFTFTYTGVNAGLDTARATAVGGGDTILSNYSSVVWSPSLVGGTLALTPTFAGPNLVGTAQTMQARLTTHAGVPVAYVPVTLTVSAPNATTLTAATDGDGVAAFTYTGGSAGRDSLSAVATAVAGTSLTSNPAAVVWSPSLAGATLALAPASAGPDVTGGSQTLQATLRTGAGVPVAYVNVAFAVTGPNATSGGATTDTNGVATFTYSGASAGTDSVQATSAAVAGTSVQSGVSTVVWAPPLNSGSLTLTPPAAGPNLTGGSQTVTATLLTAGGSPVANVPITFTVSGPNATSGTSTTAGDGTTTFTFTGAAVGQDVVTATSAPVGGVTLTSNAVPVVWSPALTGGSLTLAPAGAGPDALGSGQAMSATLLTAGGAPVQYIPVTFTVTGPNATTGTATTDQHGVAVFTFFGSTAGTDHVVAVTAPVAGVAVQSGQATITWTPSIAGGSLTLSPPSAGPDVLGAAQALTARLLTSGGAPAALVPVTLTIAGPNAATLTATTDATGTAAFSYVGAHAGVDTATAQTASVGGVTLQSNNATVEWDPPIHGGSLVVTVPGGSTVVGAPMQVLGTLLASDGTPIVGVTVNFSVGGVNTRTGSGVTNSAGVATWSYTGSGGAGTDTINASAVFGPDTLNAAPVNVLWRVQLQLVNTTEVQALFFAGGGGSFGHSPSDTPTFTQYFPTVNFNPPGGTIPHNTSGVGVETRPFTDITTDVNGNYTGSIVAQGNGQQAGVGNMGSFDAVFTASFNVAQPGNQTIYFNSDDGFILGIGGGATRVSGALSNPPASTPFHNYPVMGSYNQPTAPVQNSVTVNFPAAGTYPYELDYDECCGGQLVLEMAFGGTGLPPAGSLIVSPGAPPPNTVGQFQTVTVSTLDGGGAALSGITVNLDISGANPQQLSATSDATGIATFTWLGVNAGQDQLTATASLSGYPEVSNSPSVTWNPAPPAPVIPPPAPADGSTVTKPIPITASITPPAGQTIASWSVTYQDLDPGPVVTLASGTGTPPSPIATFDPTLLPNDMYAITVNATASGGGSQSASTSVSVAGNLKLGRYVTTYQDLDVPVNGFQMQLRRTYDSIDQRVGDFGIGWRVSLGNFRTSSNRKLGAGGWTQYDKFCAIGLCITGFKTSAPHFVTVVFPDGHDEIFDFTPDGGTNLFGGASSRFTARSGTGTTSTLVALNGGGLSYQYDGNLYGDSGPFNPTRFQLTTRDGRVFVLDTTSGLVSETDPGGNSITVDSGGLHASNGQSLTYTRDGAGRITQVAGPGGQTLGYGYSAAGDLASFTDAAGNVVNYAYDANHHLLSATGAGQPHPLSSQQFDAAGRLTAVTDGAGDTTNISTDVSGQQQTFTDALGRLTTALTYDDVGDVVRRDLAFGTTTLTSTFQYDAAGHLLNSTDPLGHTQALVYDSKGSITQATDSLGNVTRFTYDSLGDLLTATAPDGTVVATRTYDSQGRMTRSARVDGASESYTYDAAGHVLTATDARGKVQSWTYDSAGHLAGTTTPVGKTTTFVTDASGRITSLTDPGGATTTITYDADGNRKTITDGLAHTRSFTYDSLGRLATATDSDSKVTTFFYDASGRLSSVVNRDNLTATFAYDADGRLTGETLPGGDVTTYAYDPLGDVTQAANASSSVTFAYDGGGRITSTGTQPGTVNQPATTFTYAYDANSRLVSSTGPDGAIQYAYDANSRLTSLTDPAGGVFQVGYDQVSHVTSLSRPNGIADSYFYDSADNLLSQVSKLGTATVQSAGYTYDDNGRRTAFTDLSGTSTYTYAPVGQLSAATHPATVAAGEQFTYDAVGNRTSTATMASGSLTYDPANRMTADLLSTYAYDNEGDLVSKTDKGTGSVTHYAWNMRHQLLQITFPDASVTTYRYDPMGRRIEVNSAGQVSRSVYDGANLRIAYNGAGALTDSYVDAAVDSHLEQITSSGQRQFYVTDGTGSVTALTDVSGAVLARYAYDSFGKPSSSNPTTPANPFTFTGREYDAKSGLYYYRSRYYSPDTGRFLSEDPVNSVNAYPYTRGDPVNLVDPSGAFAVEYAMVTQKAQADLQQAQCISAVVNTIATAAAVNVAAGLDGVAPGGSEAQAAVAGAATGAVVQCAMAAVGGLGGESAGTGAAAEDINTGDVAVYRSLDAGGNVQYVGITNNLEVRAAAHMAQKGISIDAIPGLTNLSRADARSVEQVLIEQYGLGRNGGTLLNKINSIATSNPAYGASIARGKQLLALVGL